MKTLIVTSLALTGLLHAEVKLPSIIGDRMVLQQKQANPIWGWDNPDAEVTVHIGEQAHTTQAGKDGRWEVKLDAMPANSESQDMTVTGSSEIVVKDILVGEVWLCSGQSNMGWKMADAFGADLEKLRAEDPLLRLVSLPKVGTQEMRTDFNGSWVTSSAQEAANFSAVGYYFGKTLRDVLGIPVGLIDNSWGGSSAEAWVRRDIMNKDERFKDYMDSWEKKEASYDFKPIREKYEADMRAWNVMKKEAKESGRPVPPQPKGIQDEMKNQHRPGNLYAGILNPIIGYGIRGTIWYQGESNGGRPETYNDLMTVLISSWREDWKQGDFPFYFVQLADFMAETDEPVENGWARLREAQTRTVNEVANTGQAVITDLGQANDIHPREKRDVAERLARWALAKDYGYDIHYRSPEYREMKIDAANVVLSFDHVGGGLDTDDINQPLGFAVCGEDMVWKKADARFLGAARIEVSSEDVSKPVAVRYAWANNPIANVLTKEGLPLTPFRTDEF